MISDDVLTYLETNEIGVRGQTLFRGSMPDVPDDCVTLYEYPGAQPVYSKSGIEANRPRIQIVSRSKSYTAAMAKALLIYGLLGSVKGAVLNSSVYDRIRALQEPFDPGGKDDSGRTRITCNYQVRKSA